MRSRALISIAFSVVFLTPIFAQDEIDLERLDGKFTRQLEAKLPGWKHERGEPMAGSKNVLIQYWSFSNRKIKITITPQKSAEEAREKMEGFAKNMKGAEELKGFGDQAYSWGYASGNIVFRRGRFAVFVSTYADVDSDADARTMTPSQRGERERAEMKRLSREFAKHLTNAIDGQ